MPPQALPTAAAESLSEWLGGEWTAHPLTGDASVRAYYRITTPDASYMLAYYPEEVRGQLRRFMTAYRAVSPHAYVAKVIHHSECCALQQDLGDANLYELLRKDREEGIRWYKKAITLLAYFQRAGDLQINPPFTAEFFAAELEMTREFYVEKLMGVGSTESLALRPLFRQLSENIARHPYVLCHRDFHGQNIHILKDRLYLIDYQDMRMGPDTYDVASLLRDRGIAEVLGEETELDLVDYYAEWRVLGFPARSPLPGGERRSMRRRYFETLLQRSVKILGTFSRQPIERGRLWYLDFIPPTIAGIRRCIDELPEYAGVAALMPLDFDRDQARRRIEKEFHGSAQNHASAR